MRAGIILFLLLSLAAAMRAAAQDAVPRMLFLHLKMETNQVSLLGASVAPGKARPAAGEASQLQVEIADAAGQLLWTNSVSDPTVRRLEYEDPEHPGSILHKDVQMTNVEFVVRAPALANARQVSFFSSRSAAATNSPPLKQAIPAQRTPLGVVTLPDEVTKALKQ